MPNRGPVLTCLSLEHATLKSLLEATSNNRMMGVHRLPYTVITKNAQKLESCIYIDMTVNVHGNGLHTGFTQRLLYTFILRANLYINPP